MTLDNNSTSYSEAISDRPAINNSLGFTTPGTSANPEDELYANVFSGSSYANRYLAGQNKVFQDNPTRPTDPAVEDVAAPPEAQTPIELLGLDEGTSIPMEPRRIIEQSKRIAARNLDASIDQDAGFNKTAWIMENGEPFCNHCDSNFIPERVSAKMACTNCGCGRPNDDHGLLDEDFNGEDLHLGMAPDTTPLDTAAEVAEQEPMTTPTQGTMMASTIGTPVPGDEGTLITKGDMLKLTEDATLASRLNTTEDYLEVIRTASDSDLYIRGYMDAMNGKPLDVELAEVSDDYFHGYQQYSFYHSKPLETVTHNLHDIKPNSNQVPRRVEDVSSMGAYHEVSGPMELTQDREHSVASRLPFPTDVINKFFEA